MPESKQGQETALSIYQDEEKRLNETSKWLRLTPLDQETSSRLKDVLRIARRRGGVLGINEEDPLL